MKSFKQFNEAKATMCGRCGTKHVAPKDGGTCPGPKKEEAQIDEAKINQFAREIGIPDIAKDMAYDGIKISDTAWLQKRLDKKGMDSKLVKNREFMKLLQQAISNDVKGFANMSKAVSKFKKTRKEEVEQVDEVSKKTLKSYQSKALNKDKKERDAGGKNNRHHDGVMNAYKKLTGRAKVNATEELDEALSKVVRDKMQQLAGGTMPRGAEFRALKKKAEDEVKAERAGKATAKKAAPVVKKAQTGSGKGDDDRHIISQLRKAQDVKGNFDIGFHRDTGRLSTQEIDTLLKAHDKLKPEGKRKLRVMLRDVKSAKKVATSLKGKV